MNVSLTSELEEFVAKKVRSGLYQTASEVVREGLRLMREREDLHEQKLAELRREIVVGLNQANRGKVGEVDARATLLRVRARKQRRAKSRR